MTNSDNHSTPAKRRGAKLVITGTILVVLTAVVLGAASAQAQPRTATRTQAAGLQKDLDALVTAGAPGAILVVRQGDRTVSLASGLAAVALQLVSEGKLSLDDSVEQRLPDLVPNGEKITIRQLLGHTSGLFSFEHDPRVLRPYLKGNFDYYWAPRKLVQVAVSHKPLFAPGTGYAYSNTDYIVTGLIIEAVTGHKLSSELSHRIFQPLRLHATTFPTTPRIANPYAHGYYVFAKPPATDVSGVSPYPWAAGAIVSTGADVLSFYRALLSGHLLKPQLLDAMKTTVSEGRRTDIPGSRYGLGLEHFPTSCGTAWGHNGSIAGYLVFAFTSNNGRRQAVLTVNEDGSTLAKRASTLFFKTIEKAYCTAGRRP
jgi:D-alanyl-D-alanine carboxypeptidase